MAARDWRPTRADFHALLGAGGQAEYVRADVRSESDVERLMARAADRFGPVDVLINSAGDEARIAGVLGLAAACWLPVLLCVALLRPDRARLAQGKSKPMSEVTLDEYNELFATNVQGVILTMKHALKTMVPRGSGSIINVTSVAGRVRTRARHCHAAEFRRAKVGFPTYGLYTASKHAVEGLTKAAAIEVAASGVRVNCVAPAMCRTPMLDRALDGKPGMADFLKTLLPAKRFGEAEEVVEAFKLLASDKVVPERALVWMRAADARRAHAQAKFITGQSIGVDGGFTAQ